MNQAAYASASMPVGRICNTMLLIRMIRIIEVPRSSGYACPLLALDGIYVEDEKESRFFLVRWERAEY